MKTVFIIFLFFFAQGSAADILLGRVVAVSDGDTITVLDGNNEQHKVRLTGIDAPEKSQPFGKHSKKSLSDSVYGLSVAVEWHKMDRYRRILGKVLKDGCDINLKQIVLGYAWHYKRYRSQQPEEDGDRYSREEIEARKAGRGLWSLPRDQRIEPWNWRRGFRGN